VKLPNAYELAFAMYPS